MVGRKREIEELNRLYNSDKAQLVAIYGRRRVGKTYLVDQNFSGRITFRHAGLSPVESNASGKGAMKDQLMNFYQSLLLHGAAKRKCPKSWLEAFFMLEEHLQNIDDGTRQLIFLDELPWMDTPRSGFLTAFESFWNNWACHRSNIMIVVCGSANSWILDKLINNHGGLYNRVTYEIKLEPFTLSECKEYFAYNNVRMSDYDIAQSYMIIGGIPFYMGYMEPGLSLPQNIDKMFFEKNAKLRGEFDKLFESAFSTPEEMKSIVKALNDKKTGLTREEISGKTKISNGGTLTQYLKSLITSDFVECYVPFGESKRTQIYKLIDPFCIFWLKFMTEGRSEKSEHFWQENCNSQSINRWRGFAFENLCFTHIDQIKQALGIFAVSSRQSSWLKRNEGEDGMQIDLLIDRNDNILNMCEIKFYGEEFTVDKKYYLTIKHRENTLAGMVPRKKVVQSILITTYGLKYNEHSSAFTKTITLDDLM